MTIESYPLQWPEGWPKTKWRDHSRFKTKFAVARDELFKEIILMGGSLPVLSTNVELRRDGLPYANRTPSGSPGAAVYFTHKKKQMCFACDRYYEVKDNIQALRKTIEALRGIERWGASDMMERAFSGFESLPDRSYGAWWAVLGVSEPATAQQVKAAYKRLRSLSHPDKKGGSVEQFNQVQKAFEEYKALNGDL